MKFIGQHKIAIIIILIVIGIIIFLILKKKGKIVIKFPAGESVAKEVVIAPLPLLYNIKDAVQTKGKEGVFPMVITKVTDDVIELPLRESLEKLGAPYKFKDINTGESINIVDIRDISYLTEGRAIIDTFMITDEDYLISYTAANEHFGIANNESSKIAQ